MSSYNLNEVLKERDAKKHMSGTSQAEASVNSQQMDLGDVSRVKVLSPGRQVFKRFIRNRLAVFGSVTLIIMFLFSFLGPLFYPYGQKQIFYTYDYQNVNYALAKENTGFNGYDVDSSVSVERSVVNVMNSTIKKMIASDETEQTIVGKEGNYRVERIAPGIYTLSALELEPVCSIGSSEVKVGTYSMLGKSFDFATDEIPGLEEAAAKSVKGASGSFEADGKTYTFTKGDKPKTFDIYTQMDGVIYTGEEMDASFEEEANRAVEEGLSSFEWDGRNFTVVSGSQKSDIYEAGEASIAKVFTNYTLDTFETGMKISDDFRPSALMAAAGDGTFTVGDGEYTIEEKDGELVVYTADGEEYAEFNPFSVRRYSGEDTMAYDLKKAISAKVQEMQQEGSKTSEMTANLPLQGEDGSYQTDEDGNYVLEETQMKITQRLEGEYVINCDQINFVIDRFASPSSKHILGTDGDGFDVLARVMYGGRISLMVGFIVVIIESVLGVIMGGLAGYFGGWVDNLIMRMVDIFYCLPYLPIMIILGAMMDAIRLDTYIRLMVMMAALGLMGWAGVARMVRGQILSLREQEFMVATEATGIRIKDRIFKHLVPNVMPQLIVISTMSLGSVIITESTLSFLGLGVKHPLATWGTIINSVSSASAMAHYAHIWIPVGLLICFTVIAFNFVGDGLRDAYDPKSKR